MCQSAADSRITTGRCPRGAGVWHRIDADLTAGPVETSAGQRTDLFGMRRRHLRSR